MKNLLIAVIVLIAFSSCSNYYKAVLAPQTANADTITDLKMKEKYFILRNGSEAFAMKNISISTNRKNLQCNLETLPLEHKLHLTKGSKGKMEYSKPTKISNNDEDESAVLNEVHVYIAPGDNTVIGPYSIALDKVQKIEVLEKDKQKTSKSNALAIGISVGTVAILGGLIVAIISVGNIFY